MGRAEPFSMLVGGTKRPLPSPMVSQVRREGAISDLLEKVGGSLGLLNRMEVTNPPRL